MAKLTKEQVATLSKYEDNLMRAYKASYVRNMPSKDIDAIAQVVREAGYEVDSNFSCNACILNLCKLAGRLYVEARDAEQATPAPPKPRPARKATPRKKK